MALALTVGDAASSTYRYAVLGASSAGRSVERLSSGLRVVRASDDASGLAIAESMRARIGGLRVGLRGAQDAISVAQTADGGLARTTLLLHRLRELAVHAMSTGALGASDVAALDAQAMALLADLDAIAAHTTFADRQLLTGSYAGHFHIGPGAGDAIDLRLSTDARAGGLGLEGFTLSGAIRGVRVTPGVADFGGHAGTATTFTVDAASDADVEALVASSGDPSGGVTVAGQGVDLTGVTTLDDLEARLAVLTGVGVDRVGGRLVLTAAGTGPTSLAVTGLAGTEVLGAADVPDSGGAGASVSGVVDLDLPGGVLTSRTGAWLNLAALRPVLAGGPSAPDRAEILRVALEAAFTGSSAIVGTDGSFTVTETAHAAGSFHVEPDAATVALGLVDQALVTVMSTRALLGAVQNRVEHAMAVQAVAMENLSAARGRVVGVDVTGEVLALRRALVRSDVTSAMLRHAADLRRDTLTVLLTAATPPVPPREPAVPPAVRVARAPTEPRVPSAPETDDGHAAQAPDRVPRTYPPRMSTPPVPVVPEQTRSPSR